MQDMMLVLLEQYTCRIKPKEQNFLHVFWITLKSKCCKNSRMHVFLRGEWMIRIRLINSHIFLHLIRELSLLEQVELLGPQRKWNQMFIFVGIITCFKGHETNCVIDDFMNNLCWANCTPVNGVLLHIL